MVSVPILNAAESRGLKTRFAPSPNGALHLGHAFAAMCAHDFARAHDGEFHLRIEDIDGARSRAEHVEGIIEDLRWLGLAWDGPLQYQSANIDRYTMALDQLRSMGLVYRCSCSRSDIASALKALNVPHGPDGPNYPGTCRDREVGKDVPHCWRLDMHKAATFAGMLYWTDLAAGSQLADAARFGDIVVWRKDAPASYHLAATVDDAADGITHVVRGQDLFAYTSVHRLLQALLGMREPAYWHHPLLIDRAGNKLSKSKSSSALAAQRAVGVEGKIVLNNLRNRVLPLGIKLSTT